MPSDASSETIFPAWADAELSARLPDLIEKGEGQHLEFKEEMPRTTNDLGKEIAAFATSNNGTIILGVRDDGTVTGLLGCERQKERGVLVSRIEGVCANVVKPSVTPGVHFASLQGQPVLVIQVPKGDAPVYYASGVPYIRQVTAARPAQPQEVIELILAWSRRQEPDPAAVEQGEFLSEIAQFAVDVIVHTRGLENREVNPWLDETRWTLGTLAATARNLAVRAPSDFTEINVPLGTIAESLDQAAHEHLTMGSGWDEMRGAAKIAEELALNLKAEWIDSRSIDRQSIKGLADTVQRTGKRLSDLAGRCEQMLDQNRLEELQQTAGDIGLTLLQAATFGHGLGGEDCRTKLSEMGCRLRQLEMETIYADGGQSVRSVLEGVRQADRDLQDLLLALGEPESEPHPQAQP